MRSTAKKQGKPHRKLRCVSIGTDNSDCGMESHSDNSDNWNTRHQDQDHDHEDAGNAGMADSKGMGTVSTLAGKVPVTVQVTKQSLCLYLSLPVRIQISARSYISL